MAQWHPLFAELLRPLLERYYEVQTNMAVGDAPRAADVVVVRRTSTTMPPFRGLWQHLTTMNVLEFKGPTVSARVGDLDLLLELGLGIDRRLQEERRKARESAIERGAVSFWYLANHLGKRFLRDARGLLGELEEVSAGIRRVRHLGRWLLLVSNRALPVEADSVPVHLLVREPQATTKAAAATVAGSDELWEMYAGWLALLFPDLWEEVKKMTQRKGKEPTIDWERFVENVGVKEIIEAVSPEKIPEALRVLLSRLTPEQREELRQKLSEDQPEE